MTSLGSNTHSENRFATYVLDHNTDLNYADQRYHTAAYGRFLTPDPYQASAALSNPQSWNLYAYVSNDPVNFNDPKGLWQISLEHPGEIGGGWGFGGLDIYGLFPWEMFRVRHETVYNIVPLPGFTDLFYNAATGHMILNATLAKELEALAHYPGWIGAAARAALVVGIVWTAFDHLIKAKDQALADDKIECEKVGWSGDPEEELAKKPHDRQSPGPGWVWGGPSDKGQWHNPVQPRNLRPRPADPGHQKHWDYTGPNGTRWRVYGPGDCQQK